MNKKLLLLLSIITGILSQTTSTEKITIYSKDIFEINCDSHFFYLSMNISSSQKAKDIIPFELNLLSPQDLKFKCIIDTSSEKLNCFTFVPLSRTYRKESLFFHLFFYPPKVPGVEFDFNSFIKHGRKWANTNECGNDNYSLNITNVNYNFWNEISVNSLMGGECQTLYEDKEQKNIFYFNMSMSISDENITNYINEKNAKIKFVQYIRAPVIIKLRGSDMNSLVNFKDYAYCKNNDLIDRNNYQNIYFTCKINIQKKSIMNSILKIYSFFDKFYIKIIYDESNFELKILNTFFNLFNTDINTNETLSYLTLDDNRGNTILCPNKPIFTIKNKNNGIYFDSYSNSTNRFTFYLKGSLTNGYKYENDSLIQLTQTLEEITFTLILTDNTLVNTDEVDTPVKCILSSSSLYNSFEDTLIKCFGEKKGDKSEIDLTLNYVQKKNNNYSNIIINWPDVEYYGNKKNLYSYKITALSIQQKDFTCEEGNYFNFYINIYDLNEEPKIWFNLPLFTPEGTIANCELFDHITLQCTIDLRYKKFKKNTKISLHKKGTELSLRNDDGNENIFIINDFSDLGKNEYYFINLKEDCGENVVMGTLKDMGFSKEGSVILSVFGGLFMTFLIIFFFIFIIHCIKVRCKRGAKISTTEESKL